MKSITLSKGFVAWVDDEDFERLNAFKWCASIESRGTKVYAVRWERNDEPKVQRLTTVKNRKTGKRERKMHWFYPVDKIRMHRQVLNLPIGKKHAFVVDHIDCDGLNNCKSNLEITTQEENMKRVLNWKRKKTEEPCL